MNVPKYLYVVRSRSEKFLSPGDCSLMGKVVFMVEHHYLESEVEDFRLMVGGGACYIHAVDTSQLKSVGFIKDGEVEVWFTRQVVIPCTIQKNLF